MRVVIDGRLWAESGIGRYIRNLVKELQELHGSNKTDGSGKSNEYFVLLLEKDFQIVNFPDNNFHKVLADFKWYGWAEQIKLPRLLKSLKPDLVHFPHFNVPIFYSGKFVVTIHDLIHQHHQTREATTKNSLVYGIKKIGYRAVFSHAVKRAQKIIAPSEFVKKQLQKEWGIGEDKVTVTYEGVDERIIREVGEFREIGEKFHIKKPYLFYLGNAQPHKNILGLVRAFREIRKKYSELSLILSGPESAFWERIIGEFGGLGELGKSGVRVTGFVSEEEMVVLYKNAEVFIMPSFEEGFGIPILEAMACGCPVVSSNAASLPEVGGDAVLYFNPKDMNEMIRVLREVWESEGLREKMIKKGLQQVKKFSWERLAKETLSVYTQVG